MQPAEALGQLEALGNPQAQETYRRHGITGPAFGVRYADLYRLQKQIGVDHALAMALFDSGNHDARVLATLVGDAQTMTARQLDAWQKACDNYVLNDAVATIAARSPLAPRIAQRWRKVKAEYRSAAGWHVVGILASDDEVDDEWLRSCLAEIRDRIAIAPNRTRNAMNSALISIGGYRETLRAEALAVAKAIGKVEVDHGDTNCKTPDAVAYIEKVAVRHSRKVAKKKVAKKKVAKKKVAKKKVAKKKR